jgi:hypothetical protein
MLSLRYFPANAAYAFTFGRSIASLQMLRMGDGPMFHRTRKEAVIAARACGLDVCRNGEVITRQPEFSFA